MTPEELHILQHSLGLDRYGHGRAYRNHFCAGEDDVETCKRLVLQGLMGAVLPAPPSVNYPTFYVTQAGRDAVSRYSPQEPRLSRAQLRYRKWLGTAADLGVPFGEWLKRGHV